MKKVFIIHGLMASPDDGWFSWLINELNKVDISAVALNLPNPNNPSKEGWVHEIKQVVEKENTEEIVLVGHSLGVAAILRFLEESDANFLGVVLVSGAVQQIPEANFVIRNILKRFVGEEFNWEKIRTKANNFVVIHGKKDKKVPIEHAEIISKNLEVQPILIEGGSHFSGWENCTELPEVLKVILEITKPSPLQERVG